MKFRWYVITGIFIGLLSVPFIRHVKGSTYIVFEKTAIEFQNYFAVTALVIAFLVLWFGWLLIRYLLTTSNKTLGWFGGRRSIKARQQTIDGMIALSEGHWKTAQTLLVKSANSNDTRLINYLGAARAAQQQGDLAKRDEFLKLAAQSEPDAQMAVGLTQVELQLESQQYESALASLKHLKSINANHPFVLKLLQKAYSKLEDWKSLIGIIPKLKKHQVFSEQELFDIEKMAWLNRLRRAQNKGFEKMETLWSEVPKNLKKQPEIALIYSQTLAQHEKNESAENLIQQTLKSNWDIALVELYGNIKTDNPNKQLANAEQWLKSQPSDEKLLIALGKLSLNAQLWGKAKTYLEQSIEIKPTAEAYLYLAKTFEQLGHPINAQEAYQKGLKLSVE